MVVHLLQGMWDDHEGIRRTVDYPSRIRAAGTIAAGFAHGLNNPAAATVRVAADLRSHVNILARDRAPSYIARTALAVVLDEIQCRLAQHSQTSLRAHHSPLEPIAPGWSTSPRECAMDGSRRWWVR